MQTVASSTREPIHLTRALGGLGILCGLALLSAFMVDFAPDQNVVRIVLYGLGAIAVIVGVQVRAAPVVANVSLVIAVIAIAAYALLLARVVLPYGPWHPFAGDDGLTLFVAGMAIWLATAAFGATTAWYRTAAWPSSSLLALGSLMAMTGIDRLRLTSQDAPTIFGPVSQVGIVLTGVAWLLLGAELATRSRLSRSVRPGQEQPVLSNAP